MLLDWSNQVVIPMIPFERGRLAGLLVATFLGVTLLQPSVQGQDAAWEGLINAGRNALQQRNFAEAERQFEAALETAESFDSNDSRLGKSYNNLAAVYYAQEDYDRAEPLMRLALGQLQESLGPENTEVAQTMKNLAALYYLQGNRPEAESLLKRSLSILEQVHGPNHAYVATVLSNLAGLYQSAGRYDDAEPLLTRSLVIWETLLGPEHPDVVKSRGLLAQMQDAQRGSTETARTGDDGLAGSDDVVSEDEVAGDADVTAAGEVASDDEVAGDAPAAVAENAAPAGNEAEPAAGEIAEAATALQALATPSNADADADRALSDTVPVPARSPLEAGARPNGDDEDVAAAAGAAAGADAAASPAPAVALPPAGSDDEAVVETAPVQEAPAQEAPVQTAAVDPARDPAAEPTAEPAPEAAAQEPAPESDGVDIDDVAGVLGDAPAVDEVSFSVYLSTLWSVDEAMRYWQALRTAMPEVLGDKQVEIEEVAAEGGADPFYRVLTTPFPSDPEAEAACDAIRSKLRTHDCAVVARDTANAEG